ncbi:putative ABC transport system permease protein [Pseudidiomarina planktonica]|uniref:Putative ABC transport system permease protein n=1 Tax=Pseudidiomarina planktonica TaxID=1323738 RepID=A0A1Y6G4F1_9GAMM|nr:FtsX-like permease family protein [Pseudidiomarina planktonica]RUO63271.1 cell division protein FtsX [Pseudidiomarina planktonica]SMQ80514.1 putative ABC transport system permease protein [Pseudidiomarina planktonica]
MSELGPIFRALLRNKVGALLLALQIAVTMTIMVNAIHMIENRSSLMARPSGLDEANQFYLSSTGYAQDFNEQLVVEEDLRLIRQLPGIVDATQINAIPLSGGGWSMGLSVEPGAEARGSGIAVYFVDDNGMNTLDVELIAGRNFSASEIGYRGRNATEWPQNIIITEAAAKELFPDLSVSEAVGKTVYINNDEPMTIIGIMDQLQAPWVGWSAVERVMLVPQRTLFGSSRYFIRTEPGQRDAMIKATEKLLLDRDVGRLIRNVRTMEETRDDSYRGHQALQTILWVIVTVLTIITALGIVGMVTFSVNRRRKQIGTRRALGATRWQIIRHFLVENALVTSCGLILGVGSSIALNIWLVDVFSLPRVGWHYLPIAMAVLLVVGQLAVLGPARRAAAISPALATRSA